MPLVSVSAPPSQAGGALTGGLDPSQSLFFAFRCSCSAARALLVTRPVTEPAAHDVNVMKGLG